MKKLLIVLFTFGLGLAVTAQPRISHGFRGGSLGGSINRGGSGGTVEVVRPKVTVITRVAPVYPYGYAYGYRYSSPFYSPYSSPFYSRFNDPYYGSRFDDSRPSRPSQLDLQIEDIKNEYDFKIDTVKDDKSLSKDERKQKVRELKHQREDEIIDAKKRYYREQDENDEDRQ